MIDDRDGLPDGRFHFARRDDQRLVVAQCEARRFAVRRQRESVEAALAILDLVTADCVSPMRSAIAT